MEDLNINVVRGFKIKARSIKKEKSVYIVNTDNGVRIIKKTQSNSKALIFQNEVKIHLFENGFTNTDMYYISAQEKPFFEYNSENYIMTDYIDSKNVDFSVNDELKKALTTLGRMHNILKRIKLKEELKLYRKNNLTEVYVKKLSEMVLLKKRVKKQSKLSDFDVIFLKNYDYYVDNLKKSIELFENIGFDLIVKKALKNNEICHNLLKEEYLLVTAKKKDIYITNFTESLIDICIVDLADIIKRYIKCLCQKKIPLSEIFSIYTAENELSQNEINAIYPLLIYPAKFIKISSQYYAKRRTWVPGAINTRMNALIDNKDIENEFISNFYK